LQDAIEWRAKYPAPKLSTRRPLPALGDVLRTGDKVEILALYDCCVSTYDLAEYQAMVDSHDAEDESD
jgi:hypothetical protein